MGRDRGGRGGRRSRNLLVGDHRLLGAVAGFECLQPDLRFDVGGGGVLTGANG